MYTHTHCTVLKCYEGKVDGTITTHNKGSLTNLSRDEVMSRSDISVLWRSVFKVDSGECDKRREAPFHVEDSACAQILSRSEESNEWYGWRWSGMPTRGHILKGLWDRTKYLGLHFRGMDANEQEY